MEEPGFRVLLTESGDRKSEAIRAIRTVTGVSLWNSKLLLNSAPVAVTEPDWLEAAQAAAGVLEASGAHAAVVCDWCDRIVTRGVGPLDPAPCSRLPPSGPGRFAGLAASVLGPTGLVSSPATGRPATGIRSSPAWWSPRPCWTG
ncbi:ribosomal protein L7/L12 [Streptomyces massasporeus]|uniref:ribosomal protein L7/L12 n=1 Tax=Streptomyces massasporeus TaxID=67324 RepID=UPI003674B9D5